MDNTVLNNVVLAISLFGPLLAIFINNKCESKQYICKMIFAASMIGFCWNFFADDPQRYFGGVATILWALVAVLLVTIRPSKWKAQVYLLGATGLIIWSAWNATFYLFSENYDFYLKMAEASAVVTVAWIIGCSDDVVHYFADRLGVSRRVSVDYLD
ncbi:MAG: hypothetical protein V3W52_17200 [Syntrophobacteria bacterium]